MGDKVHIEKVNEVYLRVNCEPSISYELREYFKFAVPGAKFSPMYKNKIWDGFIYLYNVMSCQLYSGLSSYVEDFCKERGYEFSQSDDFSQDQFSVKEAKEFVEQLNTPFQPTDYQLEAFIHAVRNRRALLLSPTASGKSFIIYLITRYYNARTLIIVPNISLVSQLASDFGDYGFVSDKFVHRVFAGEAKETDKPITITTWQSVYKLSKEYFDQFDVVIGDEAHLFKAKSLTTILNKMVSCKYRFGLTGTLDGSHTNKLVLEGLFGKVKKVTTTKELIDSKRLSDFKIKCLVLQYSDEQKKLVSKMDYQQEIDYLVRMPERNNFIKNLCLSLKGNTLLLFQFVEKHGKPLFEMISKENSDKKIFYVSGEVDGEEREEIRKLVETESNCIIIASYGTFSTGINIKNLHNIVFASPSKSRIRNLQSIGRGLRKSDSKETATLLDISDDFSYKSKKNYTLLHFIERVKIYNEEKFTVKFYNVRIVKD